MITALTAEAYALKGLVPAQQIGGNKLVIQADCMEVVGIMEDFRHTRQLVSTTTVHCSRDTNRVAHKLTRRAMQKTLCLGR